MHPITARSGLTNPLHIYKDGSVPPVPPVPLVSERTIYRGFIGAGRRSQSPVGAVCNRTGHRNEGAYHNLFDRALVNQ